MIRSQSIGLLVPTESSSTSYFNNNSINICCCLVEPVLDVPAPIVGVKRRASSPLSPHEREPMVTTSATDEHNLGIVTVEIGAADEDENKLKIKVK